MNFEYGRVQHHENLCAIHQFDKVKITFNKHPSMVKNVALYKNHMLRQTCHVSISPSSKYLEQNVKDSSITQPSAIKPSGVALLQTHDFKWPTVLK